MSQIFLRSLCARGPLARNSFSSSRRLTSAGTNDSQGNGGFRKILKWTVIGILAFETVLIGGGWILHKLKGPAQEPSDSEGSSHPLSNDKSHDGSERTEKVAEIQVSEDKK